MDLVLGDVYEFATWEQEDEWEYDRSHGHVDRFKPIHYDREFGVYVGTHEKYNLFVIHVPNETRNSYKILYIENDMWIDEADFETNIPMLDKIIRYVNSPDFEHPRMLENETTSIEVPEADVLHYAERRHSNLGKNIKGAREKHRTMRKKRKAGKKISNWMTILPPLREIGFTGGPLYKRAAASFKRVFKGGKTRRVRKD